VTTSQRPNFPPPPQFTHGPHVKPFALPRADQSGRGLLPRCAAKKYADDLDEVDQVGSPAARSDADEALKGRSGTGAIQNIGTRLHDGFSRRQL